MQQNDRIVCYSDGVSQSGIGMDRFPLGWGEANVAQYIKETIKSMPEISARDLARQLVERSMQIDRSTALDDISCGVIYYRRPRELLIVSGPPYDPANDPVMAAAFENTTAKNYLRRDYSENHCTRAG